MIAPLRAWHRRIVLVLAPLLPVVFAGGLLSRHPRSPAAPARAEFAAPDVLLYWSAQRPSGTLLPADARLLGPAGAPMQRPAQGVVIAYSLAHQRIVRVEDVP